MSDGLMASLQRLGPGRLLAMAVVGAGLLGFFAFFANRMMAPPLALLYADLSLEDSGQIVAKLETLGVPLDVRGGGSRIYVPRPDVGRLRVAMAADGLPAGGSVGYEIFDRTDRLGTTGFIQQVNQVRALEGELARTIASLAQIRSARVHLVLPRRELFSRDRMEPSASIALKLQGVGLQPDQVRAIQNLVAGAVPGLDPARISVVDSRGTLLARGLTGAADEGALAAFDSGAARRRYETRLAKTVERLLAPSAGAGRVRAEVAADIDFNRLTSRDESYDPDGQVVRSTQTVEQADSESGQTATDAVTVGGILPNQDVGEGTAGGGHNSNNSRLEETVNYEISRSTRTLVREGGTVRRLSVAVLIDGTTDADGVYQPRSEAEMAQFEALIRSAVGFDEARGDVVEVANMRFTPLEEAFDAAEGEAAFFNLNKVDILRLVEVGVLAVIALLVILLVARPLVRRAALPPAPAGPARLQDHSTDTPRLAPPEGEAAALSGQVGPGAAGPGEAGPGESGVEAKISMNAVEGAVRASSVRKITDIVEQHPDETVQLMRQWILEDS